MKTVIRNSFIGLFIGVFLGLFLLPGCGDDDSPCVSCPIIGTTPRATLENIWPNADSTSWDYSFERRQWGDWDDLVIYENEEDVPRTPTPTWTDIRNLVNGDPIGVGDTVTTITGSYHLRFEGEKIVGGRTTQNLVKHHVLEDTVTTPDGIAYGNLSRSRPLLTPRAEQYIGNPIFLHGGAWRKTNDRIINYGDLSPLPSWQFLTNQLSAGDEFTFQLGAGIVDDLYLYCRVDRVMTVETQAGTFKKAIDCLYMIDYGVSALSDNIGHAIGYFRDIDAGRVIYAPTVGPVYCYERLLVQPGVMNSRGFMDVTVDLLDSSTLTD